MIRSERENGIVEQQATDAVASKVVTITSVLELSQEVESMENSQSQILNARNAEM